MRAKPNLKNFVVAPRPVLPRVRSHGNAARSRAVETSFCATRGQGPAAPIGGQPQVDFGRRGAVGQVPADRIVDVEHVARAVHRLLLLAAIQRRGVAREVIPGPVVIVVHDIDKVHGGHHCGDVVGNVCFDRVRGHGGREQ